MKQYFFRVSCNDANRRPIEIAVQLQNTRPTEDDHMPAAMEDQIKDLLFREPNIGTVYFCEMVDEWMIQDLQIYKYTV